MRRLARFLRVFAPDNELAVQLELILGFRPKTMSFYHLALMHKSRPDDVTDSNERLEFLGDAILGAIIAEYLFKKYPYQPEGYLTELRSRIVRRETMNSVALRMGINKLVQYNQNDKGLNRSHIFGNALEALIGAIYLDQGLPGTRRFILKQLIKQYVDLDMMESTDINFKNQLLTWAQKNNRTVVFDTIEEKTEKTRKLFTIGIVIDGTLVATGNGYNKKDAGQVAAKNALDHLKNLPVAKSPKRGPSRDIAEQHSAAATATSLTPNDEGEHKVAALEAAAHEVTDKLTIPGIVVPEENDAPEPMPESVSQTLQLPVPENILEESLAETANTEENAEHDGDVEQPIIGSNETSLPTAEIVETLELNEEFAHPDEFAHLIEGSGAYPQPLMHSEGDKEEGQPATVPLPANAVPAAEDGDITDQVI